MDLNSINFEYNDELLVVDLFWIMSAFRQGSRILHGHYFLKYVSQVESDDTVICINALECNSTYCLRAQAGNVAGYAEWDEHLETFTTKESYNYKSPGDESGSPNLL